MMRSPYTSPPTAIYFGEERRVYYIPQDLLQSLERIISPSSSFSLRGKISLPDVDANTGHVLVHYLYTGTYQTLCNKNISPGEETNIEFKQAILAYVVATDHQLHGLKQLAKRKVKQLGTEMSIYDIVNNVKESTRKMREPMFEGIMSYYSYTNITVRGRQKYYPLAQARAVARSSARSAVVQISKTPPNMLPRILPALSIKRGLG